MLPHSLPPPVTSLDGRSGGVAGLSKQARVSSCRPKSHVSLSLQRGDTSVLFTCEDQCPSFRASSVVSLGGSEEDDGNDAMSLAASDMEEWSKPAEDPATLLQSEPDDFRRGLDSELIRVLSKAIEELGFDRPSPHAAASMSGSCSWGAASGPETSSVFLEVHDKLTKLWRAPFD